MPIAHAALKKAETHPAGTLIETAANVAGMNRGELNRSFKVLYAFETQQLTLPDLDAMSDDYVLAQIDMNSEPYTKFAGNESAMIRWKRLELRGEMLAEIANVEFEKFWPFYRAFPTILHNAYDLIESQAKLQYQAQSGSTYNYHVFDDDPIAYFGDSEQRFRSYPITY
ncbi:hypothetical protein PSI9734_02064 [Pseudidiomarina piscicola]|uniref:Uncharacterized protein n=1 Tax=Pseudidiomarina piscicola TaxID=2614830 RepID=A0A6S6WPP4_9GAMM|nr:hypothetical protein PSI9734_02064 [Pseudidiomarina piscicola]VZT41154.1 hypothetical protein PSI9734_02064 [Pseudomonas aeruginosa]